MDGAGVTAVASGKAERLGGIVFFSIITSKLRTTYFYKLRIQDSRTEIAHLKVSQKTLT